MIISDLKWSCKSFTTVDMNEYSTLTIGLEQGRRLTPHKAILLFGSERLMLYLCFSGGEC